MKRMTRFTPSWVALSAIAVLVAFSLGFPAGSYEIDVSHDPAVREGEPSLGANPIDPNNLIVGYMKVDRGRCAVSATFDAGLTWQSQILPLTDATYTYCADPTVAFGGDGTAYMAAIAFNQTFQIGHTVVTRSGDGGKTWTAPVEAIGLNSLGPAIRRGGTAPLDGFDRPWLAFDDETGTLYLTTMTIFSRPMGPLAHRYLIASRDKGRHWGPASVVDSTDYPADHWATGTIAAGPGDTVAIAYTARRVPQSGKRCPCAVMAITTNGVTFTHHSVPHTGAVFGVSIPERGETSGLRLVYGPMVAADPARLGTYAVAVAAWNGLVPFAVGRLGVAPPARVNVQLLVTHDAGRTWTGPMAIGENTTKDREHVWLAYSPTGVLGVIWRTHAGPCCLGSTNVWSMVSRDGGTTFDLPRRLSHASSPFTGGLGDDFQSVVLDGNFLHAAWADGRSGNDDVYYARLPLTGP